MSEAPFSQEDLSPTPVISDPVTPESVKELNETYAQGGFEEIEDYFSYQPMPSEVQQWLTWEEDLMADLEGIFSWVGMESGQEEQGEAMELDYLAFNADLAPACHSAGCQLSVLQQLWYAPREKTLGQHQLIFNELRQQEDRAIDMLNELQMPMQSGTWGLCPLAMPLATEEVAPSTNAAMGEAMSALTEVNLLDHGFSMVLEESGINDGLSLADQVAIDRHYSPPTSVAQGSEVTKLDI
ncbi:hypothetical protein QQZ08_003677 [Neonectria magnoliae]|uniref:Uncharacterized protein n=1 Tax=Neonectria magnoliae TaxID=2732573 RepID=A0ABR1IA98_9HYPO